jgi:hypothetical protein
MTTIMQSRTIPESIVQKLGALIWRARLVVVLRGAMATLAAAAVAVLAIMAIDWWVVIFSDYLRWVMSMTGLVATLAVAGWTIARPLARSFTLTGVARLLESRHPELHERLSSTVELMTTRDGPELRGSDELVAALAGEAVADARAVRVGREIHIRAVLPLLGAAALVVAVLVSIISIWPNQADRLFRRAFLANVSRVSHTSLKLRRVSAADLRLWDRDGIDFVMPAGRRMNVDLEVDDPAVSAVELRRSRRTGGEESVASMTRMPDSSDGHRQFTILCPPASESFRFRIHAGDALTRYYVVQVVDTPAVSRIDVKYEYPAYTARGVEMQTGTNGDVLAVAGTVATITARTNKPLASAELLIDGAARPAEAVAAATGSPVCTFRVELTKDMKSRWSARLKDEYGFVNEPAEHAVKALADRPPTAEVLVPNTTRLKLKPTERLPIAYRMKDDFGLAGGELRVEVDGKAVPAVGLTIPPGDKLPTRKVEATTTLDLSTLPLDGARQVSFRLRATDILPPELGGPQEGFSELFTIQLDASAASFNEQVALAEELHLREVLEKVLKELTVAKEDSSALRRDVPKVKTVTDAIIARVDRMRLHLAASDAMLRKAIEETAGGVYATLTDKLKTLTNEHVAKALDLAGQIKLSELKKERGAVSDEADFQVDRSIALVQELLKELGGLTDQLAKTLELQDLAARQEELAKELEEMKKDNQIEPVAPDLQPEQKTPEEWKKAQDELAKEMAQLAKKTPGAVQAELNKDKEKAKDLLNEAKKLAREQEALKKDTERAAKAEKIDQALKDLAEKQKNLADQAAKTPAAAEAAKPMSDAADQIKADQLDKAVADQQKAEGELNKQSAAGEQAKKADNLAAQAADLAKQQEKVAQAADAAKQALAAADKKAADAAEQLKAARDEFAKAGSDAAKQQAATQAKQAAKQKGQDAVQAAAQAKQQANQLAAQEQDLARRGEELTRQAAQAGEKVKAAATANDPTPEMKQAAAAMAGSKPSEAADQAAKAAEKAKALAQALRDAAGQKPADAAQNQPAQVADLAKKQAEIRQETQKLQAEKQKLQQDQTQADIARIQNEQNRIAEQAGKLSDEVQKTAPQADRLDSQAAQAAKQAADELGAKEMGKAAEQAADAGQKLDQVAKRLDQEAGRPPAAGDKPAGDKPAGPAGEKPAGDQPAVAQGSTAQDPSQVGNEASKAAAKKADMADKAADLSKREKQLAREMQALAKGDPTAMAAAKQEGIAERTGELGKDVQRIQEHAAELLPDDQARAEAAEAGKQLDTAQGAQAKAGQALQAGKPEQAVPPQGQSGEALASAANSLEKLGKMLADAAAKNRPPEPADDAQPMADAYDAANQAGDTQQQSDADKAAQQLGALAQSATEKARAMGLPVGQMTNMAMARMLQKAQMNIDSKTGTNAQMTDLTAAKLAKLGISLTDWARLPGSLRDQVLQAAGSQSPEEYRPLIKRYFREVARRGGAGAAEGGEEKKK